MGSKKTKYEKVSDVNFWDMKGITPSEIHNTADQKHDKGYGGIGLVINHLTGKECVIGSTNLPCLIYHYKLAVMENNGWYERLNKDLIHDIRENGVKDFEFKVLQEYDNTVPSIQKLRREIQKQVIEISATRNAQYNLTLKPKKKSNVRKKKLNHIIKPVESDNQIKVDNKGTDTCKVQFDYDKLKEIILKSKDTPENKDTTIIINVPEGLDGGLSNVYKGARLYDSKLNMYEVDGFFVSLKNETGHNKLYPMSSFLGMLRNHSFMSCGALKVIKKKIDDARLDKHIESILNDGFSIEDLENRISKFKGDNNVKE